MEKGPQGQRRGRGARERILAAAQQLFREQGINTTGMDQLCAAAQVSKRTAYQHFGSKDELIAEYLRRQDPETMPEVFDRTDLTARQQLLAVFETSTASTHDATPLCPFIGAAVEIADPEHPARVRACGYKYSVAARLSDTARRAGATDPDLLGEQLTLLLDGASARTRTIGFDTSATSAGIAATLINHAVPDTAPARPRTGTAPRRSGYIARAQQLNRPATVRRPIPPDCRASVLVSVKSPAPAWAQLSAGRPSTLPCAVPNEVRSR